MATRKTAPAKKAPAARKIAVKAGTAEQGKPGPVPTARQKLDALGTDRVCEILMDTLSLTATAAKAKVSLGSLLSWIEADPDRSARVREARTMLARAEDEAALAGLKVAKNRFELDKAKEMAHHRRWRAKAIAPKEYGDRVNVEGEGGLLVMVKDLTGRKDTGAGGQ